MVIKSSRTYLLEHLALVKRSVTVKRASDRENLATLESELTVLATKHAFLSRLRIIIFIIMYAGFLSSLALPVLAEVATTVAIAANVIGLGILSIVVLYLTWRLTELWNRMTIMAAHILAIYEKDNRVVYEPRAKQGILPMVKNLTSRKH